MNNKTLTPNKQLELLALPIALSLGILISNLGSAFPIFCWLITLIFHELGHASIYWLNSQLAIPSFGMTLALQSKSSPLTFIIFSTTLILLARYFKTNEYKSLFFISIILQILLIIITIFISAKRVEEIILFAGLAGEMILGAVAMLTFYLKFPKRINWNKNRYIFLSLGAISFTNAGIKWLAVRKDFAKLPLGALFDFASESSKSDGDLDRLIDQFGWTKEFIVSSYLEIFWLSSIFMFVVWMVVFYHMLKNKSS